MSNKAAQAGKKLSWPVWALGFVYENRRKAATGAALALALFLGYHVVFGQNGLAALDQKRQLSHSLDSQLKDLTAENMQLKEHVDRLKSDPSAIEHEAREQLHYTRPGEVIYTLPAAPPSDPSISTAAK
ncbi:MAG: FtsB family cell division protein [Acidobacteriaceae bacterium]